MRKGGRNEVGRRDGGGAVREGVIALTKITTNVSFRQSSLE